MLAYRSCFFLACYARETDTVGVLYAYIALKIAVSSRSSKVRSKRAKAQSARRGFPKGKGARSPFRCTALPGGPGPRYPAAWTPVSAHRGGAPGGRRHALVIALRVAACGRLESRPAFIGRYYPYRNHISSTGLVFGCTLKRDRTTTYKCNVDKLRDISVGVVPGVAVTPT